MSEGTDLVKSEQGSGEMRQYDAATVADYFTDFGNEAALTSIVGTLLKFNKGDWLLGKEEVEVELGTQYVVLMDQLSVGWVRWEDNKPTAQVMGLLSDGYRPAKRGDLGDVNEVDWPKDKDDKPRDPWQKTFNVIMCVPGQDRSDKDNLVTFPANSTGGRNAVGELCRIYGKEMRTQPDKWPVVKLGVDSYKHSISEYGRIKVPLLTVVAWEDKDLPTVETKDEKGSSVKTEDPAPASKPARASRSAGKSRK